MVASRGVMLVELMVALKAEKKVAKMAVMKAGKMAGTTVAWLAI